MLHTILTIILVAPLIGSMIAGLFGRQVGRAGAHYATIAGVAISTVLSFYVFWLYVFNGAAEYNASLYTWMVSDGIRFEIGFMIDKLSATMMLVVTFVSLMVHIYTIGYMDHDDDYDHHNPYYQRFFSYISLFTFSMLSLVMANNFLQLFFGWEAVGLVSYLLIGFYMKRESAIQANLKAFLVNRVGDFGFILGIAMVFVYFNTMDYNEFFAQLTSQRDVMIEIMPGVEWSMMTLMLILLFVGAMGKSAQMPLHVWLPESMEGPTPISALIHAATMVTAGIFMVARLSPAYELSEVALTVVLITGALTAFLMGMLGLIQNDIKRVVAYSTLSQLGYMTAALGASAYAAGMFHVLTHAFFKALLFLAAGSVIIAMHHIQDIRQMGGLKKYMPITYWTMLIGSLALIGFPGFSGFFSKDSILLALGESERFGATFAYVLLIMGVFVTAFYNFRMFFLVFHGEESEYVKTHKIKESPAVVTVPLILLSIPAVLMGLPMIEPMLTGQYFGDAIQVLEQNDTMMAVYNNYYHGVLDMILHSFMTLPVLLALSGVFLAWLMYIKQPNIPAKIKSMCPRGYYVLDNAYGFDRLNEIVFVNGTRRLGEFFTRVIDIKMIDTGMVTNTFMAVAHSAQALRQAQTGYLYHYAFVMIFGLLAMLVWVLW
ncbi:NADH-quinone oxidoreductase subunit L [Thiomicrorhabdus heinhorstiae]|uniref:NADH-quinone oxidoreductase subunit L n=1 Tax=Thiomicrorhabdus heinhorstiae TaxID=2748010 RepID=A0ABS0BU24_9GAMM|nr:NADH-quinone oxidoreductase subunit L [Thiomicrorhabdus heinhorstiae]MBF6057280.1 NADH-quinone oxidoreductase subunit L [Thiomicrorhabdus heinhorstiae]